ncbi:MAG: CsbD family protein [Anaerolineales bacterium]
MNEDILEGKWKQVKGNVRNWWGKVTDDDLDRIGGKSEKMVGLLQERYGWTKERANEELSTRLAEYDASLKTGAR